MRKLLTRFRQLWRDEEPPRPDYSDAALFGLLAASPARCRSTTLDEALRARERGAVESSIAHAIAHFAAASDARFLAHPARLCKAHDDTHLIRSIDAATVFSKAATTRALGIYGKTAPPLGRGFPWADALGLGKYDPLYAVHPHRFGFLPPLALASATGRISATILPEILDDWLAYAARDPRIPFSSSLVVTQRLLGCIWAFAFAGIARDETVVRWQLLRILGQDVGYLLPRLDDAYPNNHLLVNRFVGWLIGLLLPELGGIDVDRAEDAWLVELHHQTYDDGGSFEHSTHYHRFACEAGAVYLLLSAINRRTVPESARTRISRMLRLQSLLCGSDAHPPVVGDCSDDPLFALDGRNDTSAGALREFDRALFDPSLSPVGAEHPSRDRAWWFLNGCLAPITARTAGLTAVAFEKAGFAVADDARAGTRCIFRMGPMQGTHYHAGHQHEDLLSIWYACDGVPLLVDPGTFTYRFAQNNSRINWRTYFSGPASHNGLVLDGVRAFPALQGDFRASVKLPSIRLTRSQSSRDIANFEARFDGSREYPGWTRGVISLQGKITIIYDVIEPRQTGIRARFAMQLSPECVVECIDARSLHARANDTGLRLAWSAALGPGCIVRGEETGPGGWLSPIYGERIPAPQLLLPIDSRSALSAIAVVPHDTTRFLAVDCSTPRTGVHAFRIESEMGTDLVLVNPGAAGELVETEGVFCSSRVAWIRTAPDGSGATRLLGGESTNGLLECAPLDHALRAP